jgi:hypothetical protein
MRRIRVLVAVLALCAVCGSSATAWEFNLTGTLLWEYRYYSQQGTRGFFGIYDTGTSSVQGPYNGWLGNNITGPFVATGSDVSASDMQMWLYPQIKINPAVTINSSLYIGGRVRDTYVRWETEPANNTEGWGSESWGWVHEPSYRAPYFSGSFPGTQTPFSSVSVTTLWGQAELPWGTFYMGKRPFRFGTALMFDGEDNTSVESLMLVAPYGPLRVGIFLYPWQQAGYWKEYRARGDKNDCRIVDLGALLTYETGPLSMGLYLEYIKHHRGPEAWKWRDENMVNTIIPTDTSAVLGDIYLKYFQGRYFFNAELAWYNEIQNRSANQSTSYPGNWNFGGWYVGSEFAPNYIEHLRAMVETGAICGPVKITGLWSWINGPDRRGRYDGEGGFITANNMKSGDLRGQPLYSNYTLFRPYSILLVGNYGMGNNSYTSVQWLERYARPFMVQPLPQDQRVKMPGSDHGYVTDANVYAGRLDYAVAANLNIYGSYLWAERTSKSGYPWGYIGMSWYNGSIQYHDSPWWNASNNGRNAPNIPDTSLGWEVDLGFDWKLLEGFKASAAFGYWQPGKWFSYACVDKNVGWGNSWTHTNPGRKIDPIVGFETSLSMDF